MQMLLSFAQEPSNKPEPSPNVWPTLDPEQRSETLTILARLLAKAAAQGARPIELRKEQHDD